jgi:ATP-dependent Clp protease adaptor protein ClpS
VESKIFFFQRYRLAMSAIPELDVQELILEQEISTSVHDLIVYNDDVNTFEFVINVLMEICGHAPEQAEQCTMLIHYKGKCSVKNGDWDKLVAMRNAICNRGISAEVE